MRLNKLTLWLFVLLLALPFAASAERIEKLTYPTEKPLYSAKVLRQIEAIIKGDELRAAGSDYATLEKIEGDYFTSTTWKLNIEDDGTNYRYLFQLHRLDDRCEGGYDMVYSSGYLDNPEMTFAVIASGSYELNAFALDGNDSIHYWDSSSFVASDPNHPTVDSVIDAVVSECCAAGCSTDFDKALWLHDWIVRHACYDGSLTHRGVDGVLMRGTGVCDSYAKCYQLMLNAAGIECARVTGLGNGGGHAWNAVKLDGAWYWVDPTWDDPYVDGNEAISGYEGYMYFCLPDELFFCDHTPQDSSIHCVSYDCNYYFHTGGVNLWTGDFVDAINESLQSGRYSSDEIDVPECYLPEPGSSYWVYNPNAVLPYGLVAEALRRMDWNADGQTVRMAVNYTPAAIHAAIHAEINFDGRELQLPGELNAIDESAFEGDAGFMSVTLGDNVSSIGPNAFAECDALWRMIVPNASTAIDDAAFDDSYHLTLVGPVGGSAETYANAHGLHFIAQ